MSADPTIDRIALSPAEFAIAYGCTRAHVHNLITRGQLRSFKLGRLTRIPVTELDRLLEASMS